MTDDIDSEVFDEEDLAEGFGAELLEEGAATVDADPEDLEDVDEVDVVGDDDDDDVADDAEGEVEDEDATALVDPAVADDEDDLALDHDVELALDEVLAETMRLTTDVEDDEDTPVETDDKTETADSVLPKQDDEFRCASCRLLKKVSQLADDRRSLCRDCV